MSKVRVIQDVDRIIHHLTWMVKTLRYQNEIDDSRSYDSKDMIDVLLLLHELHGKPSCYRCGQTIVPDVTGFEEKPDRYLCNSCLQGTDTFLFGDSTDVQ